MVTIDIEDNAINILVTKGRNIKNAINSPLESGLVKDGVVLNPDAVAQKIKEIFQSNNISERNVVASVSGVHSIFRLAHLPKIGGDLMYEAVKHEMKRLIPVPLDELHTSWQAIPVSSSENIVPMIGIPREAIDFTLSVLKQAELTPKSMDVRPLAIARLADEKDAIVINVQPFSFDIVLLVDGMPEIIRSLSFSETLIMPEEKVKEIKEELERTVNFYNNSKPPRIVDDKFIVYINGEHKDLLGDNIVYNVKPFSMPFVPPADFNIDTFIVCIGLALKEGKPGAFPMRVNMNVMPEVFLPKRVPVMNIITWVFMALAAIIIIMMVFNWQQAVSRNAEMQKQIEDLTARVEADSGSTADIEGLQAELDAVQHNSILLQSALNVMEERRDVVNAELAEIISLMPGEIIIDSISYGEGWSVTGGATSYDIIINYAYALQNSSMFQSMQLSSIENVSYGEWTFTVVLNNPELLE